MDYVKEFVVHCFALLCISAVLIITSIQKMHQHKRISICILVIDFIAILLAVSSILEKYGKDTNNITLTTIFAFIGYVIRPICIYVFIIMSGVKLNKLTYPLSCIPLLVNLIIFLLAFFPGVKEYVFYFFIDSESKFTFGGGYLRYSSHIISLGYLIWLLCISISSLKAKHLSHSLSLFISSLFVVAAVVIETFMNENGDIDLLNVTIGICAIQYYLFLYTEKSQIDSLTKLFNRETFYRDLERMERTMTGVVQFDMNGLKYINDNYGHSEGDKALATIASAITKSAKRGMYAYRLGGDEFIIIANRNSEDEILGCIKNFNDLLDKTTYHCSVGYAMKDEKNTDFESVIKEAERNMYEAKN